MSRQVPGLPLVVVLVVETSDAEAFAFLLSEKVNHARRKVSRPARFASHGTLHFISTIVRGLATQIKALRYFF